MKEDLQFCLKLISFDQPKIIEQKSANLKDDGSNESIDGDESVPDELQLEVNWRQASGPSDETSMVVRVHVTNNVESVGIDHRLLFLWMASKLYS